MSVRTMAHRVGLPLVWVSRFWHRLPASGLGAALGHQKQVLMCQLTQGRELLTDLALAGLAMPT